MKKNKIEGVTIIAGITGSGTSKTMSCAKLLSASSPIKVVALTDPVEYKIEKIKPELLKQSNGH
jgi:type II secretory ATPase GspE/PulE/Tfp pilus assembly ATPase PilB-like protein